MVLTEVIFTRPRYRADDVIHLRLKFSFSIDFRNASLVVMVFVIDHEGQLLERLFLLLAIIDNRGVHADKAGVVVAEETGIA